MSTIGEKFTAIADAIRVKTGGTSLLTLDQMASNLNAIPNKSSSDLTASGATVIVPAGNYKEQVIKSVATAARAETTIAVSADDINDELTITASNNQGTGYVTGSNATASVTIQLSNSGSTVTASDGTNQISRSVDTATQATPTVSIDSAGKITASATQTAGYVAAGTKTGTMELTTQAAKTIIPSTSPQPAVASGVYTTGDITVAAIPNTYVQPTATKAAATITPGTLNQTIAAGTYCSGAQTIIGDVDLVPGNIKGGVSIFGVQGDYTIESELTSFQVVGGTSAPTNPSHNTIWININAGINSWVFGPTQPEPALNRAWICTGTSSAASFNILKKNEVQIFPNYAKFYDGNQWIDCVAKTYQNGAWIDWVTYLSKKNDPCTTFTGGWITKGLPLKESGGNSGLLNGGAGPNIDWSNSSYFVYDGTGGHDSRTHGGYMFTTKDIDFTGKKTIRFHILSSEVGTEDTSNNTNCWIGVFNRAGARLETNQVSALPIGTNAKEVWYDIDVSSITTPCAVGIQSSSQAKDPVKLYVESIYII